VNRFGRLPILLSAAASATALAVAAGAPAQASSSPWRLAFTRHYGGATTFSGYLTGVALSKHNAWAFGGRDLSNASPDTPRAEHWDGKHWRGSPLPGGMTSAIGAASAPSAGDIWAVTQLGGNVLHWNGASWSLADQIGGVGELTGVTAFSPTDVWVFGGPGANPGLGTWHFDGTAWTQAGGVAGTVEVASPVSPSLMWGIGAGSAPDQTIVRYKNGTWQQVTAGVPKNLGFQDILAAGRNNVWVTAARQSDSFKSRLVHYNGSVWQRFSLPWTVNVGRIASDGRGGFWMTGFGRSNQSWIIHRTPSGRWNRIRITAGSSASLFAPVLIPGTSSLWGMGMVQHTTHGDAAIWAHGKSA
jgi:hypothetical protein